MFLIIWIIFGVLLGSVYFGIKERSYDEIARPILVISFMCVGFLCLVTHVATQSFLQAFLVGIIYIPVIILWIMLDKQADKERTYYGSLNDILDTYDRGEPYKFQIQINYRNDEIESFLLPFVEQLEEDGVTYKKFLEKSFEEYVKRGGFDE